MSELVWKLSKCWPPQDMTPKEIADMMAFLRHDLYPVPADCPKEKCPEHRPACSLGVCKIAVQFCGDF